MYVIYHKVDENNRFFQKLFQPSKNTSVFRKCLRCDDFLTTSNYKVKHDFLKHYEEGRDIVFEEKPLDIIKTNSILKYEITINKFGEYYDFENAEEVADEFLKNVRSKYKPPGSVLIKCGFVIENIQVCLRKSVANNKCPVLDH